MSVVEDGGTWILLNWTNPCEDCDILHFEVVKIITINGSCSILPVGKNLSVNVTDLDPDLLYDFTVNAVLSDGGVIARSTFSNVVQSGKIHGFFWLQYLTLTVP